MINIRAEVVNATKDNKSAEVKLEGHIKGKGADIRHEMISVFQCFDEVADGKPLRDAINEFLTEKFGEAIKDDENENDDNA